MSLDTLKIKFQDTGETPEIIFSINGKDFDQIIKDYELENFSHDPAAGGGYAPIKTPYWDRENYFLRSSKENDFLDKSGSALLLACSCGEWGCWNVFCSIIVTEKTIIWKNFRKDHRDWNYELKFEFDRDLYFKEFNQLPATLIESRN
jgi:hypothetical protein